MPGSYSKTLGPLLLKGAAIQWAQEAIFRTRVPYQAAPGVEWIPPKFIPQKFIPPKKSHQSQEQLHSIEDKKIVATVSVYVKNTSQANGSGHVSMSLTDKDGNVNHVSFCPGAGDVGSLIAGMSVGLLPVIGVNYENPSSDATEAEVILQKELNKREFDDLKRRMTAFKDQVNAGRTTYAVTASFSTAPVDMINEAIRYFTISQVAKTNQAIFGHKLGGGRCDLPQAMKTYNCVTAVAEVLGYYDISEFAKIPNQVPERLIKAGYTQKDIDDVKLEPKAKP